MTRFAIACAFLLPVGMLTMGQSPAPSSAPTAPPPQQQSAPPQGAPPAGGPTDQFTGNYSECREHARGMIRDQRRDFMRHCLLALSQDCRSQARAKGLRGDDAKAFRRECLGAPPKRSKPAR